LPIRIAGQFRAPIVIDDQEATVLVKRLTVAEHARFKAEFARASEPPSNRLLARLPEGPEQERDEAGAYRVSDQEVSERRLREMDPAARAAFDKLDAEDEAFAEDFLQRAIVDYVSAPPGEFTGPDGEPVTTGRQLWDLYYARLDVIQLLARTVWTENTLSSVQKNALRSLSAFQLSLNERLQAARGPRPAETAGAAAGAGSAPAGDATERTAAQSGSTEDPAR
jgi:hypothetical protein